MNISLVWRNNFNFEENYTPVLKLWFSVTKSQAELCCWPHNQSSTFNSNQINKHRSEQPSSCGSHLPTLPGLSLQLCNHLEHSNSGIFYFPQIKDAIISIWLRLINFSKIENGWNFDRLDFNLNSMILILVLSKKIFSLESEARILLSI